MCVVGCVPVRQQLCPKVVLADMEIMVNGWLMPGYGQAAPLSEGESTYSWPINRANLSLRKFIRLHNSK